MSQTEQSSYNTENRLTPMQADCLPLNGKWELCGDDVIARPDIDVPPRSYRCTFTLPDNWRSKRVVLHFDSIHGPANVRVNGDDVRSSQNDTTDAEFEITNRVHKGDNDISVQVESFDDAYLYATPMAYICEHDITARLDATTGYHSGTLEAGFTLENKENGAATKTIELELRDNDGTIIGKTSDSISMPPPIPPMGGNAAVRSLSYLPLMLNGLNGLRLWSAEEPYLYTIVVRQLDESGCEEMVLSMRYGFRPTE